MFYLPIFLFLLAAENYFVFNFHKCCKICIYLFIEHNNNMQLASNNNFWGCLMAKCHRTLKRKLLDFFFCFLERFLLLAETLILADRCGRFAFVNSWYEIPT